MPSALSFFILLLLALPAALARAELMGVVEGGIVHSDNLSNGQFAGDRKGDTAIVGSASVGQSIPVGDYAHLSFTGDVGGQVFHRFEGLNNVSPGITAALRWKMGLGAEVPWLRVSGSAVRLYYRDEVRNGWLYRAGIGGGKRITDRWDVRAEYRFERRTADRAEPQVPQLSGAVFDQKSHQLLLNGNYLVGDTTVLSIGYAWRNGDVAATTKRNTTIFRASSAITADSVFGAERYAYKLHATTHTLSVGVSWAIGRDSSLSLSYQRQVTHGHGGFDYYNSVPSVTYLYTY